MINRIKKTQKFALLSFLVLLIGCQTKNENPFVKGPYLQKLQQTEMTIVWETDTTYSGKVFYGKGENLNLTAETEGISKIQKVVLKNLEPETEYSYQVDVNGFKSKKHSFGTAVKEGSPFTFAAYGDNKNGPFNHKNIADLILTYKPLFVANSGDMIERGYVYNQWEKLFFTPAKKLMANIPFYPTIGNHEDNADYYYNYFGLPKNKAWYSFNIGNAHFAVINTEEQFMEEDGEQLTWLINDLENNDSEWTFVFEHIPPFTSGGNYYSNERVKVKNLLHPIYEKYKVDMVICGHDHHYERSKPVGSKNSDQVVTYIVGGNGGTPMRYIGVSRDFSLVSSRTFGFALISINGPRMKFREISIDNKVIDEFEYDKSDPKSVASYFKNKINFDDIKDPDKNVRKLYRSVGRKLYKKKKYVEAIEPLKKAFDADNTCGEAAGTLAFCYAKIGDLKNAEKYAMIAIKTTPLFPISYEALAEMYSKQGNFDKAIEWYKRQFKIQPDSPGALQDIAGIYEKLEKFNLAIKTYNKAISVLPNDWEIHFELAKLYEELGKKQVALSEYKKAVKWFYDEKEDDDHLLAIEKIKELSK